VEVVRVLLEQGADINKAKNDGYTPFVRSLQKGHEEVVRVLLEQGADIDKAEDEWGDSFVHSLPGGS
jgi:ankyrin repeat protein